MDLISAYQHIARHHQKANWDNLLKFTSISQIQFQNASSQSHHSANLLWLLHCHTTGKLLMIHATPSILNQHQPRYSTELATSTTITINTTDLNTPTGLLHNPPDLRPGKPETNPPRPRPSLTTARRPPRHRSHPRRNK